MKKKNYRFNTHCDICGKFKGVNNHKYEFPPRFKYEKYKYNILIKLYKCGMCGDYLPYEEFHKDSTKKFGIESRCKECRCFAGNGAI